MSSPETRTHIEAISEQIVNGFTYLLGSEDARFREVKTNSYGRRYDCVNVAEKNTVSDKGAITVWGVALSADFSYDFNGELVESIGYIEDTNTGFFQVLPLDAKTGKLLPDEVAKWDDTTKQRANVLLGRLMAIVFDASASKDIRNL